MVQVTVQLTQWRFGVLGPLEVWRDDESVPIPLGRRRAVLACLLVHAGRPVTADALVDAAWGDDLPADPRAAVHTVLSRLRTLLGDGLLRSEPAGYRLAVAATDIDAGLFEQRCRRADSAPPAEAGRLLDQALGSWRGPAYAEFADRDFAATEAARLDLRRLDAIEARAALLIDGGDLGRAIDTLESMLAQHPFREHALRLLMTALYRAGRGTDALARFRDYRALLADQLGLDPSPELRDLETRILGHDLPPPRASVSAPSPPAWLDTSTAFVGRDETVADLAAAVATTRVLTVTGVGGVGKTRLVAEALPLLSQRLSAPAMIVELAPIRSGQVDAAVADSLGLGRPTGSVRRGVLEYLSISDGLLVLDNCEHLVADVASLVDVIVRRCPRIRIVATSRRRLGVLTERVFPLEPLPVPSGTPEGDGDAFTAAVRLFADRVRRVRPAYAVTGENLPAVADICRRLDGLPLALELAAARTAVLGAGSVRDTLATGVRMLADGGAAAGLRGVMDWSYGLLGAGERRLLAMVSAFAGDFDAEAVQAMASAEAAADTDDVPALLAELVDASLLSVYEVEGRTRYRMLTLVREFAAERLTESGRLAEVRRSHADWIRHLVQTAAADLTGADSAAAFLRIRRHRADIDAAVRWVIDSGDVSFAADITGALGHFALSAPDRELSDAVVAVALRCAARPVPGPVSAIAAGAHALAYRGDLVAAKDLAVTALQRATTSTDRFLPLVALGVATLHAGELDESIRWWRQITDLDDLPLAFRADAHSSHAVLACYRGDLDTARAQSEVALAAAQASGSAPEHAFALYASGEVALATDRADGARLLGEAAAMADRAGAAYVAHIARLARLAALVRLGRHDEALALATPLLDDVRRAGEWPQLWTAMRILAELLAAREHPRDAAFLLAAANAADSAPPLAGEDVPRYRRLDRDLRARLGDGLVDGIAILAQSAQRTQVLERALTLLADLADLAD